MDRAAIHEAAHVTACLLTGTEFSRVYLHSGDAGRLVYSPGYEIPGDKLLFILAAGAAAEKLFFGDVLASCTHDFEQMLDIFAKIGYQGDDVEACSVCIARAERLLIPHIPSIKNLARILAQKGEITYQELMK